MSKKFDIHVLWSVDGVALCQHLGVGTGCECLLQTQDRNQRFVLLIKEFNMRLVLIAVVLAMLSSSVAAQSTGALTGTLVTRGNEGHIDLAEGSDIGGCRRILVKNKDLLDVLAFNWFIAREIKGFTDSPRIECNLRHIEMKRGGR